MLSFSLMGYNRCGDSGSLGTSYSFHKGEKILLLKTQTLSCFRTFNAGIEPDPVMCQTVNTTLVNYCAWASCGEWCLTKTTGFCPQIHATVRRNGTDILFQNCTRISNIACPQVSGNKIMHV